MNDAQLLQHLAATDVVTGTELPAAAWSPAAAFDEVERRTGVKPRQSAPQRRRRSRVGWLVAAAAFAAVIIVGAVLLLAIPFPDRNTVATTAPPPPTPEPPTTVAPPENAIDIGAPLDSADQALLDDLKRVYNRGDSVAAAAIIATNATASLAPWVSPADSPSSVSLVDRIATAGLFGESVQLDDCARSDVAVRCQVTVSDRFSDLLELEAWLQTWVIQTRGEQVISVTVSGESPTRAEAMDAFQQWVIEREPGAELVVAGTAEWQRTVEAATAFDTLVVEYAALQGGVPEEAWELVSGFYESLNQEDIAGAEALFAPGATYEKNDGASAIFPRGADVGSLELTEYFTFWHAMLEHRWRPTECTGTETTVSCRTESSGVATLHRPGGTASGVVVFTLGPAGIEVVDDRIVRSSGSSEGGGPGSNFDIRGFWRAWMLENAPAEESVWPDGNGDPELTAELARIILELYPPYLADHGIAVPDRYLDGSLLTDL